VTSRDELERQISEAHERFFACFEGFDETILETQPVSGVWSARDLAGHLADWHNEILNAAEWVLTGSPSNARPIRDIELFNTDRAALRGIESWERAASDLRSAMERARSMLDQLDDGDLERVGERPTGRVDNIEGFFGSIADHTRRHTEDAESWRWRMLGVPERHENL
jgi:hypothetical protein